MFSSPASKIGQAAPFHASLVWSVVEASHQCRKSSLAVGVASVLSEFSVGVQEQAFTDVEMPGQYLGGAEVAPEAVVFLERIGSNVGIVRRHATSYRRLALHGSDGKTVHFLAQTGQHWSNTSGTAPQSFM